MLVVPYPWIFSTHYSPVHWADSDRRELFVKFSFSNVQMFKTNIPKNNMDRINVSLLNTLWGNSTLLSLLKLMACSKLISKPDNLSLLSAGSVFLSEGRSQLLVRLHGVTGKAEEVIVQKVSNGWHRRVWAPYVGLPTAPSWVLSQPLWTPIAFFLALEWILPAVGHYITAMLLLLFSCLWIH